MRIKNRYKILLVILIFSFLVFLPHSNLLNNLSEAVSQPTILQKVGLVKKGPSAEELAAARKAKQDPLLAELTTTLAVNKNYAIAVYDINNKELFGLNQDTQFHAASVMKLLVATTAFKDIEAGKYDMSKTVEYNLQQMINQSNNNSWDYFNNLQGFDHQQAVADQLGIPGAKVWGNQMTTHGIAVLLQKIYNGHIISDEHRDQLFSYMQNTETENRITKGLPAGVTFYHKTGHYNGGVHDAAIVLHPKNPFIIVVFTNDTTGTPWETRFASIAEATRKVYSYFDSI